MGWKCLEWTGPKENNVQRWTGSGNSNPQQASGLQSDMGTEALAISAWYYVYSGSTAQRKRKEMREKGWAEQTQHCVVTKMTRDGLQSINRNCALLKQESWGWLNQISWPTSRHCVGITVLLQLSLETSTVITTKCSALTMALVLRGICGNRNLTGFHRMLNVPIRCWCFKCGL